jgi:hypothetical protein
VEVGSGFIDSVIWGDIHVAQMEPGMSNLIWGYDNSDDGGLLDVLAPKPQFCHDVLDFRGALRFTLYSSSVYLCYDVCSRMVSDRDVGRFRAVS